MGIVQKYYDCGCALTVTGERVWCPSCSSGGSAAKTSPTVVSLEQRIADLERQLAEKQTESDDMRSHYKWALAEIEAMRPALRCLENLLAAVTTAPFGFMSKMADQESRLAWYDRMVPLRKAAEEFLRDYEARNPK